VLAKPHPLPGAEGHSAVADGKGEIGTEEAGLGMSRHVVGPFTGVLERNLLRDEPVQHHLHVVPHVRVPILVDGEAGGGVEQLDMHDSNLKLS